MRYRPSVQRTARTVSRGAVGKRAMKRLAAAAALAISAAVLSGLAAPREARADPGLVILCWQQSYACTTGGYAGQPPSQWPNKQWASGWGYWNGASVDGSGGHHNCTLYAAYREALNGVPDPGNLGNAADWAAGARAEGIPVNGTPGVGAIADWTGPNQPMGVGPAGHVAYVEVVTSQYIETTEDNFDNNDTGRRRIYVGSSAWPNAFIHFGPPPGPPLANDDPPGGPAVVHDGYTSVFTVNADHTLEETFLPVNGGPWDTQNMAVRFGTPPVAAGTAPVAVVHGGYTSVFTINAAGHTLQETYLAALGQPWHTQSLAAGAGTPPVAAGTTPAVVFHGGYLSVFTVNAAGHTLQETYLSALGQAWHTQSISAGAGTPPVARGSSPAGVFHTGYTSVFTVNAAGHTLQETYLTAVGQPWHTQSLSARYGTPPVASGSTPAPVLHTDAAQALDFTSVFTLNAAGHTLQETYLAAVGQPWHTQSLAAGAGTPPAAAGTSPAGLYHTGYTSVYTINADHTLQETFLAVNGQPWHTQSLSARFGTPAVAAGTSAAAVVHPDHAGIMDFTSVYTVNATGHTLQETYLPAIGDPWTTQTLPTPPTTTPPSTRPGAP
jgi:surface antigen